MTADLNPEGVLLWSQAATSLVGTTTVEVSTMPTGELGITFEIDEFGRTRFAGLALNRTAVQQLRHVLTTHLIATAPESELR